MKRLILVLGDQVSPNLSSLKAGDAKNDSVVMAEVQSETTYVKHHPKKIIFVLAAMRHCAERLRSDGWTVHYTPLDDPQNSHSISGELMRRAAETGATEVLVTQPGEWRLIQELEALPLKVTILPDDRFLSTPAEFSQWAEGRKQLRMEYFYREMRRKTGLLMDGDQPEGGKWNYDHDNRKAAEVDLFRPKPIQFDPDETTQAVIGLVAERFPEHFGSPTPFWFATTPAQAEAALIDFIDNRLPGFGDIQDAMLLEDPFLNHAVIGLYLNAGLLDPLDVCQRAEAAYGSGQAPLNAVEGFIRQILGWREFIRGIYFHEGPDYTTRNALGHERDLPAMYWGAPTDMACMAAAIGQTEAEAYAHHIQRLMVTGNFALLAGVAPYQVHEWYLAVYADAYEWVEAPNVIGMSQFADGGVVGSKPYVSSGAYINRMSDYCKGCAYKVSQKTGETACPFNLLYWHFLVRHRDRFAKNPRMAQMYRTWDKMDVARRDTVLADADAFLTKLDSGERV